MVVRTPRTGGGVTNASSPGLASSASSPDVLARARPTPRTARPTPRTARTPQPSSRAPSARGSPPTSGRPPRPSSGAAAPVTALSETRANRSPSPSARVGGGLSKLSGLGLAPSKSTPSLSARPSSAPPSASARRDAKRAALFAPASTAASATGGGFTGRVCDVEELYVGGDLISPAWLRVSTTPWTGLKAATGGYGRRVRHSSVSAELPDWCHIPAIDGFVQAPRPRETRTPYDPSSRVVKTAASDDAPDWFTRNARSGGARAAHRKVVAENRVLLEPVAADDAAWCFKRTFQWDSARGTGTAASRV